MLKWDFNVIKSLLKLSDFGLLFGTILMTTLIFLFVLKYDKEIKLKLKRKKELPEEDGSFEYGSSRWATKKEIKV